MGNRRSLFLSLALGPQGQNLPPSCAPFPEVPELRAPPTGSQARDGGREARRVGHIQILSCHQLSAFSVPASILPPVLGCYLHSLKEPALSSLKTRERQGPKPFLPPTLLWKFNSSLPLERRHLEKQVLPVSSRNAWHIWLAATELLGVKTPMSGPGTSF